MKISKQFIKFECISILVSKARQLLHLATLSSNTELHLYPLKVVAKMGNCI